MARDSAASSGEDERQGLLEDYRALRGELLTVQSARLWGVVTYLALVGGLVALRTDVLGPWTYVFLMSAAPPLLWHTANRERSRMRIAAYIKGVIEPRVPGLGWEAHLAEWRGIAPSTTKLQDFLDRWRYILSLTGIYALVSTSCFLILVSTSTDGWAIAAGVVALAFLGEAHVHFSRILRSGGTYEQILREASERVR